MPEPAETPRPSPTAQDLQDLFEHFNRLTDSLRRSHEELERQVERLQRELADKKSELERKKRLEALGRIAAGLAHEIRNPLGSMVLYLDVLREEAADRPRALELVAKIRKGIDLVSSIVEGVLTFAKPGRIRPEPCRPDAVAREAAALVEAEARSRGVTVRVDAGEGAEIRADRSGLRRILINLLRNAVEASPEGAQVEVEVGEDGDGAAISVRDRGPGIPVEDLDRVFLPFWSGKETGTGLGLAIVHTLVESHGGAIRIGNRSGGGVEVEVRLPAAPPPADGDLAPCRTIDGGAPDA